jgi:DNA-directed RNA polymerase subunit beta'
MGETVDRIMADRKLPAADREQAVIKYVSGKTKEFEDTLYEEMLKAKNPFAMQVLSGARGNPGNLRSIVGSDLLYEDHHQKAIPIPIRRSYAEGLSPVEYWAGTFGTRKGVADLKFATQDAGFFGKQLNQAAHRLVITKHDVDQHDGSIRGVPTPVDDPDNEGALLAQDVGGYKRNTVLTPKIMAEIKASGHEKVLLRSPMVGGPPEGGLYAADVGVRERGGLPPRGDNVGMAAAQALSEPVTQAQISSKHTGGVAGAGAGVSGFKYINQLVQVPKTFTGGAAHSQIDGKVGSIYDAPAGGKYVMINGQRHYVQTGFNVHVKTGDTVEAGDVISDGLPNPAEIVTHKGIGEGRRYFVDILRKVYKDSSMGAHRRNIELLSRGLINHVRLQEEMGDYNPEDVVPYDVLEHVYEPRDGHEVVRPKQAVGRYLEKPILHYSIGTKVRPSMLKDMEHFGVSQLTVHPEPPPFQPEMIRAMENLVHDPDWMTRQLGSNLKKGLLVGAHRGAVSDEAGTSFVPGLARAETFGQTGLTKGWDPKDVKPLQPGGQL